MAPTLENIVDNSCCVRMIIVHALHVVGLNQGKLSRKDFRSFVEGSF